MIEPTAGELAHAVAILRAGGLVGMPTETVYGLAADASNPAAVRRIFVAKGRPASHPIIVHLPSPADLTLWATAVPQDAHALAGALWPGPLTLVLRRAPQVLDAVTGGRDTVALRVPAQPTALALLRAFGGGLAAPSANRFGRVSPTTAAAVRAELGDAVELVLDAGPCAVGIESTILDLSVGEPVILRPGGCTAEEIETVLRRPVVRVASGPARAPGMLANHYSPDAVVVVADSVEELGARVSELGSAGRTVGILAPDAAGVGGGVALDTGRDLDEYARRLYDLLRHADRMGLDVVVALAPQGDGITVAIRDRLRRAAAG